MTPGDVGPPGPAAPAEAMAAQRDLERDLAFIRRLAGEDAALHDAYAAARDVPGRPSVSPEAGRMLFLLARLLGARRALEVGAGAGYSGIWIARGLAEGGRLDTIELSDENADVARRSYEAAGVADRVRIVRGAALDVLPTLEPGYDLCFLDAVKSEYPAYLDHALALVRPGGVICADNVLWRGLVSDGNAHDEDTDAVRAFDERIMRDETLVSHILPLGDGLSISLVATARS